MAGRLKSPKITILYNIILFGMCFHNYVDTYVVMLRLVLLRVARVLREFTYTRLLLLRAVVSLEGNVSKLYEIDDSCIP